MLQKSNQERAKVSKIIMEDMFQIKKGETVAITADSGTDKDIANALAAATLACGGIPLLMWIPRAEKESQAGMKYWPSKALTAALREVDVWIEMNSMVILYSDIWEIAMKENKKLRYLIIADSTIESLNRVFTGFSVPLLGELLSKVREMSMACKTVQITSTNGTDVSYDIDLNNFFDIDNGDYSEPKFGTAPGFVNIVPKVGSMNGTIVFDMLQNADANSQLSFEMKNGSITDVKGTKPSVEKFNHYLGSFKDENMYKISHNMLGLNPNIRELSGELVEDERIWGGVDFGFGHTSAMDLPPHGQEAASHFDGIVTKVSIFFDEIQIMDDGVICHTDLIPLAKKLIL
ncbi:M29 family metallopeptidase [Labilibacter marinus]|uniref:hypothetical protein n=1 Tax=Labilibacter marinus TaxID=1477105 RepID=UPI00094F819A|nr:hypothetical protein [Labilibacter marinus]